MPKKIPPWRDKSQEDVVLHLGKNSRSSSLEVEETDVREFSAYIDTVMDCEDVMVEQHDHAEDYWMIMPKLEFHTIASDWCSYTMHDHACSFARSHCFYLLFNLIKICFIYYII